MVKDVLASRKQLTITVGLSNAVTVAGTGTTKNPSTVIHKDGASVTLNEDIAHQVSDGDVICLRGTQHQYTVRCRPNVGAEQEASRKPKVQLSDFFKPKSKPEAQLAPAAAPAAAKRAQPGDGGAPAAASPPPKRTKLAAADPAPDPAPAAAYVSALRLGPGELMHSTNAASAAKRKWLAHAKVLARDPVRSYCSTDGSSTGWHACVFVPAGGTTARLRAQWGDMEGSRNVGAEASGFLLGVQTVTSFVASSPSPPSSPSSSPPAVTSPCQRVTFLADFLNALAWSVGAANYKHAVLARVYGGVAAEKASHARALAAAREAAAAASESPPASAPAATAAAIASGAQVSARPPPGGGALQRAGGGRAGRELLDWEHCHHPGHQKDDSWFTLLNQVADNLASLKADVDVQVPLEELRALTVQGKKAQAVCEGVIRKHSLKHAAVREQ